MKHDNWHFVLPHAGLDKVQHVIGLPGVSFSVMELVDLQIMSTLHGVPSFRHPKNFSKTFALMSFAHVDFHPIKNRSDSDDEIRGVLRGNGKIVKAGAQLQNGVTRSGHCFSFTAAEEDDLNPRPFQRRRLDPRDTRPAEENDPDPRPFQRHMPDPAGPDWSRTFIIWQFETLLEDMRASASVHDCGMRRIACGIEEPVTRECAQLHAELRTRDTTVLACHWRPNFDTCACSSAQNCTAVHITRCV